MYDIQGARHLTLASTDMRVGPSGATEMWAGFTRLHKHAATGRWGDPGSRCAIPGQRHSTGTVHGPKGKEIKMPDLATNASEASSGTAVDSAGMEALTARANALFFQIMDLNMTFEEKTGGQKAAKNKSGQVTA